MRDGRSPSATPTSLTRLAQVVVAVRDVSRAAADWTTHMRVSATEVREDARRGRRWVEIGVGGSSFALWEPTQASDPVGRFLTERGEGVFGLRFEVNDLEDARRRLRDSGTPVTEVSDPNTIWIDRAHMNGVSIGVSQDSDAAPQAPSPLRAFLYVFIVVPSRDHAAQEWERRLGLRGSEYRDLPDRGMRRMRFSMGPDNAWLGLAEPLGEHSDQRRFLERHSQGVYMVGVRVDDPPAMAAGMAAAGASIIGDVHGLGALFVHPKTTHGVLLRLASRTGVHSL
jgi:hypothetical protein